MKLIDFKTIIQLTDEERENLKSILDKDYMKVDNLSESIQFAGNGNLIIPISDEESILLKVEDPTQWTEEMKEFRMKIITLLREFINGNE